MFAAVTWRPGRVDHVVPDLAGVAVEAAQRLAVDDDAGAHSDSADQIDDVGAVARTAADMLGEDGQIRVVAEKDRQMPGGGPGQFGAEPGVPPFQVGGELDGAVVPVDGARHADSDGDRPAASRSWSSSPRRARRRAAAMAAGGAGLGSAATTCRASTWPPSPTAAVGDVRDVHVDRDRVGAVGPRSDEVRRRPGPGTAGGHDLADHAELGQVGDQGTDGRAAQTQPPVSSARLSSPSRWISRSSRPRLCDRIASGLARRHRSPPHRDLRCVDRQRAVLRRRLIASTEAATSSTAPVMISTTWMGRLGCSWMPFGIIAITSAPTMASRGLPRPPNSDVPPMTAAATENSRMLPWPEAGLRAAGEVGEEQAADRRHARAEREAADLDPVDRHAGAPRGFDVAADGVQVPSPGGPGEQDREEHHEGSRNARGPGHALDRLARRWGCGSG